ncbi:MAG: hypothetical protein MUF34_15545, partial [Polyangiaceae bacterium]|nr:hypothetical protein [Polyangiaceae bacterium]
MPSYRLFTGAASSTAALSARHVVASFHDFDRAFCAARSVDEQRAIAALVPAEPAAVPEAHALQADLLLRVWRLRPDPSLPPWRHLPLPGSSRLAWARLALRVDPAGCRAIAIDEPALWASALEGLDMLAAPDPRAVLEALFEANDAAAEQALRDALPQAVARGLLSPPDARAMLVRRGDAWAFSTLALPWASGLPLPLPELRRALRGEAAKAALQAAAARGLWGEIRFLLTPPLAYDTDEASTDWALRRAAVEQAGRLGDNETVGELLALALVAPFELGNETLRALVAMHRRGHFVRASHVDAVLALLAAGATLPVDELAGLLFVARREIMAKLPADADDPLWLVLAPLLARWRLAPRPPAGLLEALQRLAREARRPALLETVLGLLRGLAIDVAELDHGRL